MHLTLSTKTKTILVLQSVMEILYMGLANWVHQIRTILNSLDLRLSLPRLNALDLTNEAIFWFYSKPLWKYLIQVKCFHSVYPVRNNLNSLHLRLGFPELNKNKICEVNWVFLNTDNLLHLRLGFPKLNPLDLTQTKWSVSSEVDAPKYQLKFVHL
jgi:hypothetical protein